MMACFAATPPAADVLFLLVLAAAPAVQPGWIGAGVADTLLVSVPFMLVSVSAFLLIVLLLLRVVAVPERINRKRPPSGSSYCARAVKEHDDNDDDGDGDDDDEAELVGCCVSLYDAATYLTLLMLLMLLLLFLLFLLVLSLIDPVIGETVLLYWLSCHDLSSASSWDSAICAMLLPVAPEVSSPSLFGSPLPAKAAATATAGVVLPTDVDGNAEVVLALVSVSPSMPMISMGGVVEGGVAAIEVDLV